MLAETGFDHRGRRCFSGAATCGVIYILMMKFSETFPHPPIKLYMTPLIVFISQTLFNIFKVLEIKYTYQNRVGELLLNSVWINIVSLTSVFYSIESLLKGDFYIIIFYIGGSVAGKWIGMKLGNPRNQIWKKLFQRTRNGKNAR